MIRPWDSYVTMETGHSYYHMMYYERTARDYKPSNITLQVKKKKN